MENPYQTPASELEQNQGGGSELQRFERFSTWYVFGLSIITLSFYLPYWMYTRSKILNTLPSVTPIGSTFINVTVFLFIASFLMVIPEVAFPDSQEVVMLSQISSLISNIFFLVWVFKFRNRLNDYLNENVAAPSTLGPVLTFFFSVWYLSFKLNENIEVTSQATGGYAEQGA